MSSRRAVVLAALATLVAPRIARAAEPEAGRAEALRTALSAGNGVAAYAARRGILFGTQTDAALLEANPPYAELVARECALVAAETALRADRMRPDPGSFDFRAAERLAAFARDKGMTFRGTALLWHESVPGWVPATLTTRAAVAAEMLREVTEPVRRFRGRADSWDVVTDAIDVAGGLPEGLRRSFWREKLGDGYIATAFAAARAADPAATLVLRESGIEADRPEHEAKRRALLGLLTNLRRDGVPVDALGIEGRLSANAAFDPERFGRYLGGVRALGLKVLVTGLAVSDERLPRDRAARETARAKAVADFLSAVLLDAEVTTVVARFDAGFEREPVCSAVQAAFATASPLAPSRSEKN